MKVPITENSWVEKISRTQDKARLDLIMDRPVVAWFSQAKLAVRRLQKITARLGDDLFIILGADKDKTNILSTLTPRTLDTCLRYLDRKDGWVLCEFPDELSYAKAVVEYLSQ